MKKLLILGAGGYGRTVEDIAKQLGSYQKIAFLDDRKAGTPGVLGKCEDFLQFADDSTEMYPAFGNNEVRMAWLRRFEEHGIRVPVIVHPSAYVSPLATLYSGVTVLPKAVINTGTVVENGTIINIGVLIDHDCVIEAGCHLAPGAIIKAENRIPAGMKIEAGHVIENRQYPL